MIARAALALLAAPLMSLPAVAAAQPLTAPVFARCTISDPTGAAPFALERFTADRPELRFETTSELGLQQGKQSNIRSFLTRRSNSDWQLWLVHDWWDQIAFLPPDTRLLFGGMPPVAGVQKGDNRIFALDPRLLLAAHPYAAPIAYGFRAVDDEGQSRGKAYLIGSIDRARLARALAEAERLAAMADSGAQPCAARGDPPPEAVDPAAYGECRVDGKVSAWWDRGYLRLIWQYRLSPAAFLGTDQQLPAEAMQAKLGGIGTENGSSPWLGGALPLTLSVNYWTLPEATRPKVKDQLKLSIDLVTAAAKERLSSDTYGRIAPAIFQRLAPDTGGMTVRILGPSGQLVEESRVPPGIFAAGDAALHAALRELAIKLRDPMTHCAPPTSIIVT